MGLLFYTLTPMVKQAEWYPADDVKRSPRAKKHNAPKLRAGLEPGKVLILLSGRFRGKRVVFLKRLDSGLLLVTGPHKTNGVPLKRVNQVYTMTTSAKVSLHGADVSKINDAFFERKKRNGGFKSARRFFEEAEAKSGVSQERIDAQKAVDGAINKNVKADMKKYLHARFSLTAHDKPHAMK